MPLGLLPYAVMRAAAWPIETASRFAAPDLTACAQAVLDLERAVHDRRPATIEVLHSAVPRTPDRRRRAALLLLKRHVHGSTDPLPAIPDDLDPRLAADLHDEQTVRTKLAETRACFERMYAAELERQQATLRDLTLGARFGRALSVANPSVAAAWTNASGTEFDTRRPKRKCDLENTVFHYLMRACGRATPHGAWAGMALVYPYDEPGSSPPLRVSHRSPAYVATVNLRPFALMLRRLTRDPRYCLNQRLRLNPTLSHSDAVWHYEREYPDGHFARASLRVEPLLQAFVETFAGGQERSAGPLIDVLTSMAGGDRNLRTALERAVAWLVEFDVLRGNLHLSAEAPDPWHALADVTSRLLEPERSQWSASIGRMRGLCERLEAEFDNLPPQSVINLIGAVRSELLQLWGELEGRLPPPVVHLDMRLGVDAAWSSAAIRSASQTVRELLDFHAAEGAAELFRRQTLVDLLHTFPAGGTEVAFRDAVDRLTWSVPPPWHFTAPDDVDTLESILTIADGALSDAALEYCRNRERELEPVHMRSHYKLPPRAATVQALPGPWGSVLLRLVGASEPWIGPGGSKAAPFATRVAGLLQQPGTVSDSDPPIIAHLRQHVAAAAAYGIQPVEVLSWNELNPNSALQPFPLAASLDPHATGPRNDLRLTFDGRHQRLWLRRTSDQKLLIPLWSSMAAIGDYDVCSRALAVIAAAHGWEFLSFGVPPLRAERGRWHHLPRLQLPCGAVISPERWTLDRAALDRIIAERDADRYLAWRQEISRLGVPDAVYLRTDFNTPELLLRTDSPLAVRALLAGRAARAPHLELSEIPADPAQWPIRDAQGRHYVAELAVSWVDSDYWRCAPVAREVAAYREVAARAD